MTEPKKRPMTNSERIHNFGDVIDVNEFRECVLNSLLDEHLKPVEHLDETDTYDIIRDILEYGKHEKYNLHPFTNKSINKCKFTR